MGRLLPIRITPVCIKAPDFTTLLHHQFQKLSSMASFIIIVALIGNVVSILTFLSPLKTFNRVVQKKSTEGFSGHPYVATLLSTSLWTLYGALKPGDVLVATVNGAGAFLQGTYLILYLIYAPKETRIKYLKVAGTLNIGFLSVVMAVILLAIHANSVRITICGFLCAGLTLCMYASPLAAMRIVIKSKSVEFMPFTVSLLLFLNAVVWTSYAVLVQDYFIGVPNAIGLLMGAAQLAVYMIFDKKSSAGAAKSTEKMEEQGLAQLVGKDLEMGGYKVQENKERNLNKGRSLPKKTSVSRQLSFQKIIKTHSLSPYELQTSLAA